MPTFDEIYRRRREESEKHAAWESTVDTAALDNLCAGVEQATTAQLQTVLARLTDVRDRKQLEWPTYERKRISLATLEAGIARLQLVLDARHNS